MESNRVNIRRFDARYLVPRDHHGPHTIKARLDDALAATVLGPALAAALSVLFAATDESIWVIRRLDLNVELNAAWDRDQLTHVIATKLSRTLASALRNEENDGNVLWFANRAAYLAAFLSDLVTGSAWGSWYYESFTGLKLLSTSAALRSAICRQPDTGREALLLFSEYEVKRVLLSLTAQDALLILHSLAGHQTAVHDFECCQIAWSVCESTDLKSLDDWQLALGVFLTASRQRRDASGSALKAASIALVSLTRLLTQLAPDEQQGLLVALTNSDLAALYQTARGRAEDLTPLLSCSPAWISEVVATLRRGQTSPPTADAVRRDTSFGGVFLLLPLLDELTLMLAKATSGWQQVDEAAAITLARFLLLIKCCGRQHAQRAFYDPLLRDLMLVPPTITPSVIGRWSASITTPQLQIFLETLVNWQESQGLAAEHQLLLLKKRRDDFSFLRPPDAIRISRRLDRVLSVAAQHVLRAFAWRLPGFAESNLRYLAVNFLNFPAGVEEEVSRRVVYVGRPPLHLVLGLTGMLRQNYRLSWLDERPLSLFPEN
jgi:hypothetical protein